nr:MAG TPA: hypothetical protein [Caudoviricetes sp.]
MYDFVIPFVKFNNCNDQILSLCKFTRHRKNMFTVSFF